MKTPNLDHEIERLKLLERTNNLSKYGKELITEYKAIKEALSLYNVSQQHELLLAYEKSQYETTWFMSEAEATNRINDFLANNGA